MIVSQSQLSHVVCTAQAEVESRPNLFGGFLVQDADDNPVYASVPSYDVLRAALDAKLAEHNESNTVMDLVLFQQVSCDKAPALFRLVCTLPSGDICCFENTNKYVGSTDQSVVDAACRLWSTCAASHGS